MTSNANKNMRALEIVHGIEVPNFQSEFEFFELAQTLRDLMFFTKEVVTGDWLILWVQGSTADDNTVISHLIWFRSETFGFFSGTINIYSDKFSSSGVYDENLPELLEDEGELVSSVHIPRNLTAQSGLKKKRETPIPKIFLRDEGSSAKREIPTVLSPKKQKDRVVNREQRVKNARDRKASSRDFYAQGLSSFFVPTVSADAQTVEMVKEVNENVSIALDKFPEFMKTFTQLANSTINVNHDISPNFLHVPAVIGVAAVGLMAMRSDDRRWQAAFAACTVGYAGITAFAHKEWFEKCVERITSHFNGDLQAQGLVDNLDDIVGLLVGYMSFATARSVPRGKKFGSVLQGLGSFDRTKMNILSSVSFVTAIFQRVLNWFRSDVLGIDQVNIMLGTLPELKNWCDRVVDVANLANKANFPITSENADRIHTLIMEGAALTSRKLSAMEAQQVKSATSVYLSILRNLEKPFIGANILSSGPRIEPVCILLLGKPGVGKTWATLPLIKEVLLQVVAENEHQDVLTNYGKFVYNRVPEHKYWDAYNGQVVTVMDDFGQTRDVAGTPDNEYMDMIRSANIQPYICHMADLSRKGVTAFKSKLIFASSNRFKFEPESIWEAEAVMRRFDFIYEVTPKAEYCIDPDAAPGDRRLNKNHPDLVTFSPDIYEFREKRMRPKSAGALETGCFAILSYDEVVKKIVAAYREHTQKATEYLSYLDGIGRKLESQSGIKQTNDDIVRELERECFSETRMDVQAMTLDEILASRKPRQKTNALFRLAMDNLKKLDWLIPTEAIIAVRSAGLATETALLKIWNLNTKAFQDAIDSGKETWFNFVEAMMDHVSDAKQLLTDFDMDRVRSAQTTIWTYVDKMTEKLTSFVRKYAWMCNWKTYLSAFVGMITLAGAIWKKDDIARVAGWVDDWWRDHTKALGIAVLRKVHGDNPDMIPYEELAVGGKRTLKLDDMLKGVKLPVGLNPQKVDDLFVISANMLRDSSVSAAERRKLYNSLIDSLEKGSWSDYEEQLKSLTSESGVGQKFLVDFEKSIDLPRQEKLEAVKRLQAAFLRLGIESGVPRKMKSEPKLKSSRPRNLQAEGGADLNEVAFVEKVSRKSHYTLRVKSDQIDEQLGFILFVRGNVAIMPQHFRGQLRALVDEEGITDLQLTLENQYIAKKMPIRVSSFLDETDQSDTLIANDLCLVQIPEMHQHPDITKAFVTKEQIERDIDFYVRIFGPSPALGLHSRMANANRVSNQFVNCKTIDGYTVRDCLLYRSYTQSGDCGAIVSLINRSSGPGKLLALHIAGNDDGLGAASIVTKEDIQEALQVLGADTFPPAKEVLLEPQCMEMPFPGNFVPYLKLGKAVSQPMRSKCVPSLLHNRWTESRYAPAMMRPTHVGGVLINPYHVTLSKYGKNYPLINENLMNLARDYYFSYVMRRGNVNGDAKPRVYSFEEACAGIEGLDYCNSIPRGTSAGYPYVMNPLPGYKGKQAYFGKDIEFDFERPMALELKAEVEEIIEAAKRGERKLHVFVDTLKDETRKKDRVREGKTRIISASPLAFTVVVRMYMLDFMMFLMRHNVRVGVGVGLNPYSQDWNLLAQQMKFFGDNLIAGDVSGYDTDQQASLLEAGLEMWNLYHNDGEENMRIRRVLFKDISNSIHLCGDVIYQWIGSLPSGMPATVIVNSINMNILMICCWMKNHPRGVDGLSELEDNMGFTATGDDSLVSVTDAAVEFMNYKTIAKSMAEFGITYTDESKLESLVDSKSLSEVGYLKRGFRHEPILGRMVAPLEIESILEMIYWTKSGAQRDTITRGNIDNALLELSLHSKQDFQTWAPLVVEGAREVLNYYPSVTNRLALLSRAAKREYVW